MQNSIAQKLDMACIGAMLICFYFSIMFGFTFGYYCQNRNLEIYGQTSSSENDLYSILNSYYGEFRRAKKINCNITTFIGQKSNISNDDNNKNENKKQFVFSTFKSTNAIDDRTKIIVPLAAEPLVIIFNIPNVAELNLALEDVAEIYKGKILFWNDAKLKIKNPNVKLPNERILPISRQDSDVTTTVFTRVLSYFDAEWNSTYGEFESPSFTNVQEFTGSTKWPENSVYMYGNGPIGMVGLVNSIDFSIGYSTLNTAYQYSVNVARVMTHSKGVPMYPSVGNVNEAMYASYNTTVSKTSIDFRLPSEDSNGYPMSAFSYLVLSSTYDRSVDCCIVQELVGLVDFVFFAMDETILTNMGYIPLIPEIKKRIIHMVLPKIKCQEGVVYELYLNPADVTETWQTALLLGAVILGFLLLVGGVNAIYEQNFNVDINRFLVNSDRIRLVKVGNNGDSKTGDATSVHSKSHNATNSVGESHQQDNNPADATLREFMTQGIFDENKIYLDELVCKIPQQWSSTSKRSFAKCKNMVVKNVAALLGVTVINFCPFVLFEFCSKGTLHYVLKTSRFKINDPIKYQFAMGIALGMKYLHQYRIIHGYLSSLTCYLDASWTIKICQWEKLSIYQKENIRDIAEYSTYDPELSMDDARLIELLYVDPNLASKLHESADVYSFGNLVIEIFTRQLPFADDIELGLESYQNVLRKKFVDRKAIEPSRKDISNELHSLCVACLSFNEKRPTMNEICSFLQKYTKTTGSILDIIMDALEAHNDELEEKVNERTSDLNAMNDKMQDLLHEVLPAQIADQLLSGLPVLPEYFECISIYFSDIVGFTTISARSSPNEVMAFLNDLWTAFDSVMEKFDVYKVDTIGDAYFVCSGLPNRNGNEHIRQIALLSLGLMERCNEFKIRHLPDEQLKIRIGVHSGPAGAGVIGSKMPQYCVFGDTVNIAMTMEGTSIAQKIQISESSYKLLNEHFHNKFEMEYRGVNKGGEGKEDIATYWLNKQL